MKKVLILFLFVSCSKNEQIFVKPEQPVSKVIKDTSLSITMDRCPSSILTCFLVDYPNYKDTMRVPISWKAMDYYYFNDTLLITKKNQLIWTNNLFYHASIVKF